MKITVLAHAREHSYRRLPFLIHLLVDEWRRAGARVDVARGPRQATGGDVLIPHLDLTRIPDDYVEAFQRYPVVFNRGLPDISKRVISSNLVSREDDYAGEVIVKTDLNCRGLGESRLNHSRSILARLSNSLAVRFGPRAPEPYSVYPSARHVPSPVWDDAALVVERFLPERRGQLYVLRNWVLLGERGIGRQSVSHSPVVRSSNAFDYVYAEVPAEVRAVAAEMGMDYGKLDYVFHDGTPVVFDVYRTPSYGGGKPSAALRDMAAGLAPGILEVIKAQSGGGT